VESDGFGGRGEGIILGARLDVDDDVCERVAVPYDDLVRKDRFGVSFDAIGIRAHVDGFEFRRCSIELDDSADGANRGHIDRLFGGGGGGWLLFAGLTLILAAS